MTKRYLITVIASLLCNSTNVAAFIVSQQRRQQQISCTPNITSKKYRSYHRILDVRFAVSSKVEDVAVPLTTSNSKTTSDDTYSFIQTELRGAAMKLHTKVQSPKEGEVEEDVSTTPNDVPYITTHADYLSFLIDSQHVYKAMEEIVNQYDVLAPFRNTGLERVVPLELDIEYMMDAYNFQERPSVGKPGRDYAQILHNVAKASIPAFLCHYYNHYFAHTAGGRMIGKQMSALLLDKKTLEFYKVCSFHNQPCVLTICIFRLTHYSILFFWQWDGDLNEIKDSVKHSIEQIASTWTDKERHECVDATKAAFEGGGAINSYLSGRVPKE